MSAPQMPPWLQEQIMKLQQSQQNLQSIMTQRQHLEMEKAETEKALEELKKVADTELASEEPSSGTLPTKESSDAIHQETAEDNKKEKVLKRKHALACPDPEQSSEMTAIQTVIENMTEKMQDAQKALQKYTSAVALPVKNAFKEINDIFK